MFLILCEIYWSKIVLFYILKRKDISSMFHYMFIEKIPFFFFSSLVISCGDPGALANGIQFGSDFTFNKTVSYQCNPGYLMEPPSSSTMRCIKDSTWNQSKPICKGVLSDLSILQILFWYYMWNSLISTFIYIKKKKKVKTFSGKN